MLNGSGKLVTYNADKKEVLTKFADDTKPLRWTEGKNKLQTFGQAGKVGQENCMKFSKVQGPADGTT